MKIIVCFCFDSMHKLSAFLQFAQWEMVTGLFLASWNSFHRSQGKTSGWTFSGCCVCFKNLSFTFLSSLIVTCYIFDTVFQTQSVNMEPKGIQWRARHSFHTLPKVHCDMFLWGLYGIRSSYLEPSICRFVQVQITTMATKGVFCLQTIASR